MIFALNAAKDLDLSTWDTRKVTNMSWMFYDSPNINTTITLRKQTSSSIDVMFWNAATASTARINVYADSSSYSLVNDEIYSTKLGNSGVKVYLKGRVS